MQMGISLVQLGVNLSLTICSAATVMRTCLRRRSFLMSHSYCWASTTFHRLT